MGYSEFIEWLEFEAIEMDAMTKMDFYHAQNAALIAASSGVKDVKISDYMFSKPKKELKENSSIDGIQRSKDIWQAAMGKKASYKENK